MSHDANACIQTLEVEPSFLDKQGANLHPKTSNILNGLWHKVMQLHNHDSRGYMQISWAPLLSIMALDTAEIVWLAVCHTLSLKHRHARQTWPSISPLI